MLPVEGRSGDPKNASEIVKDVIQAKGKRQVLVPAGTGPLTKGRRAFFTYSDLGVTAATEGRLRAQIIGVDAGMTQPTGWHYHVCEAQFVYVVRGWLDLAFEDGTEHRLKVGDSLLIPGGVKHNEFATSDDFQILEVSLPADMGTIACEAPVGRKSD